MQRHLKSVSIIFLASAMLSACTHLPDHAKYIPKDAVAVAGVNLKALSKKIAWNMITGSKLFQEMQNRIPQKNAKDAVNGIEKAGLDVANIFYIYVKPDERFKGSNRVTALVPLADAGAWEAYVKMASPGIEIKEVKDRKEASLNQNMYVGWNKHLLIILNVMPGSGTDYSALAMGGGATESGAGQQPPMDAAAMAAEMEAAFTMSNDNSIVSNKHFAELQSEEHDVTLWLNYEQLMTKMTGTMAQTTGMSLPPDLFKDAAFAAGFDFKMGKITSDMRYYLGVGLRDMGSDFGGTNADADMISRLPTQNMDMLAAIHISPKGLKGMLEKLNLLGLANIGLSSQNLTVDYVLDAFTGDMAFVMNDFSLKSESVTDTFMGQPVVHQNQKPSLSMSYVIKINKKENFQKLVKFAKDMGLHPVDNGFVIPVDDKDSVYILMNDQYVVSSNKYANAAGFLKGDFKSQQLPQSVSSAVNGHPWAFYFDVQQFCKNIDPGVTSTRRDSFMINESKKLLSDISLSGGEFKNSSFVYHLDVNFMNKEENSIIELMDYSMKMNDAGKLASQ